MVSLGMRLTDRRHPISAHSTPAEWSFSTVPQHELNNRTTYQPRGNPIHIATPQRTLPDQHVSLAGKMLGGCSAINAMIFQHGSPEDFDQWESEMGATGWNNANLKPYFRKAELFSPHPDHKIDIAVSSSASRSAPTRG